MLDLQLNNTGISPPPPCWLVAVQVVPGFRVRVMPVLGPLPAVFGQFMAAHVLARLAQVQPAVSHEPVLKLAREHYQLLHARLVEREESRGKGQLEVEVRRHWMGCSLVMSTF